MDYWLEKGFRTAASSSAVPTATARGLLVFVKTLEETFVFQGSPLRNLTRIPLKVREHAAPTLRILVTVTQ